MRRTPTRTWRSRAALIVGVLCLAAGCSDGRPPTYPASGRVVFGDGSPVRVGAVELKSRDHPLHARGEIDIDGRFVLSTFEPGDGAVAGEHDCVIVQLVVAEAIPGVEPTTEGVVHPRFGSYATSKLTCSISETEINDLTIRVEGVEPLNSGGRHRRGAEHEHRRRTP